MNIKDCSVIVTGGASGLGEACVRKLVAEGAKVAILDLAREKGDRLASELGPKVIFAYTDITQDESAKDAIDKTMSAFGALNVVINCAGVADAGKVLSKKGPLALSAFNRVIQINLVGTFNVLRLAVEQMVKNEPNADGERGVIINTASVAAFDGQVGQPAYSASKAGVAGMTLPLARECGEYGIRVMTIAPGIFQTPMMAGLPEKVQEALGEMPVFPQRLGRPEEYAALVQHILENPMLNGEVIRLDGGLRMAAK
jgi:3-hydroxyacyl-CoA dehydrogenase / 3-hydroxy-2-methylbutyryl-CoA dehydrogenase